MTFVTKKNLIWTISPDETREIPWAHNSFFKRNCLFVWLPAERIMEKCGGFSFSGEGDDWGVQVRWTHYVFGKGVHMDHSFIYLDAKLDYA